MDTLFPTIIELSIHNNKLLFKGSASPWLNEKTQSDLNTYYTNGLSKYVEKINFEVVTDINECKKIWQYFSPNKTLFDLWEFRMIFHKVYKQIPYFLTIKKDSKIMACLPLEYEISEKAYSWFGTCWQEGCHFFSIDPFYTPILLFFAPKPLKLYGISAEDVELLPKFIKTEKEEGNFYVDLEKYISLDEYFSKLSKKKRYNLKRDLRIISNLKPIIFEDKNQYFNEMVKITNNHFHKKGEKTDFDTDPKIETVFRNMVTFDKNDFKTKMLRVEINGKIAGIDIIAEYNNVYYPLRGGNDTENFPGIGNFLNIVEIEDAIKKEKKEINFLQYNYGWKNTYLEERKRFKYIVEK